MKAKSLLRISACLLLFHLLGHSYGTATWKVTTDPLKKQVISGMTDHRFPFMGVTRSMGEYFDGYGLVASIFFVMAILILWTLSGAVEQHATLVRKILGAVIVCLYALCLDEFIFFFPFAAINTLLAAVVGTIAWFQLRETTQG